MDDLDALFEQNEGDIDGLLKQHGMDDLSRFLDVPIVQQGERGERGDAAQVDAGNGAPHPLNNKQLYIDVSTGDVWLNV